MASKKLRICMVSNNFPPAIGGAELYAQGLSEKLAEDGHEVFVLTRNANIKEFPKREMKNGVNITRFYTGNFPGIRFVMFFFMVAAWLLKNKNRIDIVHAYHVFSTGFMMSLIGKFIRKPLVVRDGEILSSVEAYYRSRFIRPLVKYNLKNSRTYADNKELLNLLNKFHSEADIKFLQNPVDTKIFAPGAQPGLRKKLGLKNELVVAYIGRMITEKGLYFLLHAMPDILKKSENVRLLMVGYGSEKQKLEKITNDLGLDKKVIFTGKVPFEDVHKYYQVVDVFVQPSITEETPNTTIQAMSAGNAIVATGLVMSNVLRDKENSLIIKHQSEKDIANIIISLIEQKELRKRLGENAREHAEKNFSWESHVSKVLNLYEKSLA